MGDYQNFNENTWPFYLFKTFIQALKRKGYASQTLVLYKLRLNQFGSIYLKIFGGEANHKIIHHSVFSKILIRFHYLLDQHRRNFQAVYILNQFISTFNTFQRWYCVKFKLKGTKHYPIFSIGHRFPKVADITKIKIDKVNNKQTFNRIKCFCLTELFVTSALRVKELIKLRLKHIDLKNERICLDSEFNHPRVIYLSRDTIYNLSRYVDMLKARHKRKLAKQHLLFPNRHGTFENPSTIYKSVRSVTDKFFTNFVGPHVLRVSCGFHLYLKYHDELLVQKFMGYKSMKKFNDFHKMDIDYFAMVLSKFHPRSGFSIK